MATTYVVCRDKEEAMAAAAAGVLWLKGLPLLVPTQHVAPRVINGRKVWGNQTASGQNKLGPSETRWKERSRTYEGIAEAMATQWTQE